MLEEVQGKDGAVTLKIIGAGFGRTGTWSTQAALNRLGFPCYHMQEVVLNKANRRHLDFWRKVANSAAGSSHDWNSVLRVAGTDERISRGESHPYSPS